MGGGGGGSGGAMPSVVAPSASGSGFFDAGMALSFEQWWQQMTGALPSSDVVSKSQYDFESGQSLLQVESGMLMDNHSPLDAPNALFYAVVANGGKGLVPNPPPIYPDNHWQTVEYVWHDVLGRWANLSEMVAFLNKYATDFGLMSTIMGSPGAGSNGDVIHAVNDIASGSSGLYSGSHATGLDYVPFDGYRAELHKGERVLTADRARQLDSAVADEVRSVRDTVDRLIRSAKAEADRYAEEVKSLILQYQSENMDQSDAVTSKLEQSNRQVTERIVTVVQTNQQNSEATAEEIRQLKETVEKLIQEQRDQTGALIRATFESTDRAANKVVEGHQETVENAVWDSKSEATFS